MRHWPVIVATLMLASACGGGAPTPPTPTLSPLSEQGRQVFTQNCAACHALAADTIIVGPSLAGVATRAASRVDGLDAKQYIEQSILKPDAYTVKGFSDLMPKDFGKKLTGDELDALVVFLLTLK